MANLTEDGHEGLTTRVDKGEVSTSRVVQCAIGENLRRRRAEVREGTLETIVTKGD